MANICSTYIQIYPREKLSHTNPLFKEADVLKELLAMNFGNSYCTPTYTKFGKYGKFLEVGLGEKWGATAIRSLFEQHSTEIDKVFVRYFDNGSDYDQIFNLQSEADNEGLAKSSLCRYGFDKLRYYSVDKTIINSTKLSHNYHEIDAKGSYLSQSELTFDSVLPAAEFEHIDHGFIDIDRQLDPTVKDLIQEIESIAYQVEYYYKGKLVTTSFEKEEYQRRRFSNPYKELMNQSGHNWIYFPYDSFFNCVNDFYTDYITKNSHEG